MVTGPWTRLRMRGRLIETVLADRERIRGIVMGRKTIWCGIFTVGIRLSWRQ